MPKMKTGRKKKSTYSNSDCKDHKKKHERVQQYPSDYLVVKDRHLRCECCHCPLSSKQSSVQQHLNSRSHISAREAMNDKKRKHSLIENYVHERDASSKRMNGDTLDMQRRVKRLEVARIFMTAGIIPLIIYISLYSITRNLKICEMNF